MALCDGLPALLAGNAVVAKPDAQTMLSALLAAELLEEAGFPRDLWQVVAGPGPEVGAALIERADYICFTGSTATGRLIAQGLRRPADRLLARARRQEPDPRPARRRPREGRRGRRAGVVLQRRPAVRLDRADVRRRPGLRPVRRAVRGPHRGDDARRHPRLGQRHGLADLPGPARDRRRPTSTTRSRRAPGCSPAVGPGPTSAPYFYEPTILEGVTPEMTCFGNETFGPVIAVYRFHDEADAIARANEGEYGLNASIYSQDGAAGPGHRPRRSGAARSTSTRPSPRRSAASTRRWAACASRGSAAARAARASSATPSRRRSRPSG